MQCRDSKIFKRGNGVEAGWDEEVASTFWVVGASAKQGELHGIHRVEEEIFDQNGKPYIRWKTPANPEDESIAILETPITKILDQYEKLDPESGYHPDGSIVFAGEHHLHPTVAAYRQGVIFSANA
ncbi:MAG TPA: hypothetical protein VMR81_01070 [Patescibacteria group bacterium]|nr:hypothetical protein [Patescibacteria group bacterium]